MLTYCTYCSAEKKDAKKLMAAIERYKSTRIKTIYNLAQKDEVDFIILSGKYGILDAKQEIDYYDHLLIASEVEKHVNLIVTQLKVKNITKIVFYMSSIVNDKNLKPYLDCITMAASKSNIDLEIRESQFSD